VISDFHHGLIDYGSGNNTYLTDGYDPTSTATTPNNGVTPGTTFDQGFPLGQLQTKNLTPSYGIGSTFDYWSRYANTVANVQSWNLSVQTQLAPTLLLMLLMSAPRERTSRQLKTSTSSMMHIWASGPRCSVRISIPRPW
jgi:hypothetical protein